MAFMKRMRDRWQASATYTLGAQWNFDQLPLNPGCQYHVTFTATGSPTCDVPITLAPDVAEDAYYLSGAQRHRATFNGIWDAGFGFQLSGLYIFGDNGWATPTSGVDVRQLGASPTAGVREGTVIGRLRTNGSVVERNSFDLASMHRVDLRILRRFQLGGRARIDGLVEVFNVFNRANYETYVLNESSGLYGRPEAHTNIAHAPRMLQLGFQFAF